MALQTIGEDAISLRPEETCTMNDCLEVRPVEPAEPIQEPKQQVNCDGEDWKTGVSLEQAHRSGGTESVDDRTAFRTAATLFVKDGRLACHDERVARTVDAKAEIRVIAIHEEAFEEDADGLADMAWKNKARAGEIGASREKGGRSVEVRVGEAGREI